MNSLIETFPMGDWEELSLLVEGDRAVLHWRANVTFAPKGRSERFSVVDIFTRRDGKFIGLHQSTDTAQLLALIAP